MSLKVYLHKDGEKLLIIRGKFIMEQESDFLTSTPEASDPDDWTPVQLPPYLVAGPLHEVFPQGPPRRIWTVDNPPPLGEELPFTGVRGDQYWWNGKKYCDFDFRLDAKPNYRQWPPEAEDGPWVEGLDPHPGTVERCATSHVASPMMGLREFSRELPPPMCEELMFTDPHGTQYWWNGQSWGMYDFRKDPGWVVQNWPPPGDGTWVEGPLPISAYAHKA